MRHRPYLNSRLLPWFLPRHWAEHDILRVNCRHPRLVRPQAHAGHGHRSNRYGSGDICTEQRSGRASTTRQLARPDGYPDRHSRLHLPRLLSVPPTAAAQYHDVGRHRTRGCKKVQSPLSPFRRTEDKDVTWSNKAKNALHALFPIAVLRNRAFMLYLIADFLISASIFTPYNFLVLRIEQETDDTVTDVQAAWLPSILGIATIVGQLLTGLMSIPWVERASNPVIVMSLAMFLNGTAMCLSMLCKDFTTYASFCSVVGVVDGKAGVWIPRKVTARGGPAKLFTVPFENSRSSKFSYNSNRYCQFETVPHEMVFCGCRGYPYADTNRVLRSSG